MEVELPSLQIFTNTTSVSTVASIYWAITTCRALHITIIIIIKISSVIIVTIVIIAYWLIVPAPEPYGLGSAKWKRQRTGQLGRLAQMTRIGRWKQHLSCGILCRSVGASFLPPVRLFASVPQPGLRAGQPDQEFLPSLCYVILKIPASILYVQ